MIRRIVLALAGLAVVTAVAVSVAVYLAWQWLHQAEVVPASHRTLVVAKGAHVSGLARELHQQGLLAQPELWRLYARLTEKTALKAGEYALPEKVSPSALLDIVLSGNVITYQVTLVEGYNLSQMLTVLHSQAKLEQRLPSDPVALQQALAEYPTFEPAHPEGWLFPDTYQYIAGDSDLSIVLRAYQRMQRVLDEEWATRAEGLPYDSPYEALIMASIVEKETGAPHEREQIAGVFVRRLQKRMRLQTDPTVIYGLGTEYEGNLTRQHLRTPTPYNTYTQHGLPPTPIASPGRAAIHAALHPADGDALYFVAKGDGTHTFSPTLEAHLEAVRAYQKVRRKDYRSTYQKIEKADD